MQACVICGWVGKPYFIEKNPTCTAHTHTHTGMARGAAVHGEATSLGLNVSSDHLTLIGGFVKPEPFNKLPMNCSSSDPKDTGNYEMIEALWVLEKDTGCWKEDFLKKHRDHDVHGMECCFIMGVGHEQKENILFKK